MRLSLNFENVLDGIPSDSSGAVVPRMKTWIVAALLAVGLVAARPAQAEPGILLLAHGGSAQWDARVRDLVAEVDRHHPTEVAFGMATRASIQGAIDRLVSRGASEIVAVPLFVSSWSSVITSTEYLLGLRPEAPDDLALFASMDHAAPGAPAQDAAHAGHDAHESHEPRVDGTTPIVSPVPIRMTAALNDHPIVADILASRARSISRVPGEEAVIIVAHGPTDDEDNRRWLADMASLAARVQQAEAFASIDYLTLRDDAPDAVRNQATAELRGLVGQAADRGRRVLIVPLLISLGGIDRGLRMRLEGLHYTMPDAALLPDERLVTWVLAMAEGR